MSIRLLTLDEAASVLGKHPQRLRRWLKRTPLDDTGRPLFILRGRDLLFTDNDLSRVRSAIRHAEMQPSRVSIGNGHVYFIKLAEFVKIGWALNARERLETLQTGSPYELALAGAFYGTMGDEKQLHSRFGSDRVRGEWFRSTVRLRREIRALTNHKLMRDLR